MNLKDSERFLAEAQVGRLGTSLKNMPYVTPLNFVYQNGRIYFHCAKEGKKLANINDNKSVCFEVDEFLGVKNVEGTAACTSTAYYRSVIAFGHARIIKSIEDRRRILEKLVAKYLKQPTRPVLSQETLKRTTIVEIQISQITGKRNLPAPRIK